MTEAKQPFVWSYVRESTDKQVLGLEVQKDLALEYHRSVLAPQGCQWGGFFEDPAVSTKKRAFMDRKGGYALANRVERGDHVIFSRIDRAFRSFKDFAVTLDFFKAKGVGFHLLDPRGDTTTAAGEMVLGILASVAQYERYMIGARTREAKQWMKKNGMKLGGHDPLGFRWKCLGTKQGPGGGLKRINVKVKDDEERRQMAAIVRYRLQGHGWDDIYFHFLKHKVRRTKGNREWSRSAIRRAFFAELALQLEEGGVTTKEPSAGCP
jgi:DNA invertase Pin-like site-specific DNA recombinase